MNLKRQSLLFIVQICPLLVYGTVSIASMGTQIIGNTFSLNCTILPFDGVATWAQEENVRTTCTNTFCSDYNYGNYTTFSFGSNYIEVTFDPVHSSIDGVWQCTHSTLESSNVTVSAMNKTSSGGTNTSTDNDEADIGILCGCLVIAYIIVIIALCLYIGFTRKTSGNCFLTFCQFIKEKFFDRCGNKLRQGNWVLGFMYLVLYGVIVEVIVLLAYYGFQEVPVILWGFLIVLVLSCLCLLAVWMLMKFVNNETPKCEDKPENSRLR